MSDDRGVTPSQETDQRLPSEGNTRVGQRGSGHLAVSLGCLGGRFDKTGDTQMTASGGGEAVGKPGVAGVYTNQRLSLSTTWEGPWLTCRGFKPDSGNPTVRECVQLKTGVFSRRQTCRGKSQEPRSSGGRVAGNQNPEAHRQGLPWGGYELPGRNNSERVVASKSVGPRAEPASEGRRQHGMPKSDRCGIFISAG